MKERILMKNLRQTKLMEIIVSEAIETQEELQTLLKEAGFDVTQATVSRDIKDLRICKTHINEGKYRYAPPAEPLESVFSSRMRTVFRESVSKIDCAQNLTIIKTLPGMAPAACSALDAMNSPMVVGTLAGDDTAFIALRNEAAAIELAGQLRAMLGE
jgi:transcriptional regulator of arginine metabolism